MTKVNLKVTEGNTTETILHEVSVLNIEQFQETMVIVSDIFETIQNNDSLKSLFQKFNEDSGIEDEEISFEMLFTYAIGAFDLILKALPTQAIKLVSVLSGVKPDLLKKQDYFDFMDIFDAVLEVNDLEKMHKRGKSSLAILQAKTKFLKKRKKATAKPA